MNTTMCMADRGTSVTEDGVEHQLVTGGSGDDSPRAKRPYASPVLEELGDIGAVTLGPTPGNSESGNPNIFRSKKIPGTG